MSVDWVVVDGATVVDSGQGPAPAGVHVVHSDGLRLVPGFVDMHCHGGGGAQFSDGAVGARQAARAHLLRGTTSVVASLVTAPAEDLLEQIASLRPLVAEGVIAGIHLEGPWINPAYAGAHRRDALRGFDFSEIERLLDVAAGALTMVTLAPELAHSARAIRRLREAGVLVAIGHTAAGADATRTAIEAGARVATHLFNAMPPMLHREPGVVCELLTDPRITVEIIADMHHLDPTMIRLIRNAVGPERIALISDAMGAACCGDGSYSLGGQPVDVAAGVARLSDSGALAGSTICVADALSRVVAHSDWTIDDALVSSTVTPSRVLGRPTPMSPGSPADLLLLDEHNEVVRVMKSGRWIDHP